MIILPYCLIVLLSGGVIRYYMICLLQRLSEVRGLHKFIQHLNAQDVQHVTVRRWASERDVVTDEELKRAFPNADKVNISIF